MKPMARTTMTPQQIRCLWNISHRLFQNSVACERSYTLRRYQVRAAVRAVAIALAGRNAGIELPTGTGKTVIACLVAVFWKHFRPESKILLIVPSRTLVVQHFDVARWIAQEIVIDHLTDQQSGDPGSLRRTLLRGDLIISTPGILSGCLQRGIIDVETSKLFDLVVVDEFDQFVVIDEDERQSVARFAINWQQLMANLSDETRYIVKSATLGIGQPSDEQKPARTKSEKRSLLIDSHLSPIIISIPELSFSAVVPFMFIITEHKEDASVDTLIEAVSISKGIAHLTLDRKIGPIDYTEVERRARHLCMEAIGKFIQIRTPSKQFRKIVISKSTKDAFCYITKLLMMPQFILEDLTCELSFSVQENVCIKTRRNIEQFLQEKPILIDNRINGQFRFERGTKTDVLIDIIRRRSKAGERGVVFCRTITLLEGLKPIIAQVGAPVFELTGEKNDDERRFAVQGFRESEGGILIMTRTTGGRGLDLPFAHYAVFYSPKTDPVSMWQEMSRIRSTVSNPKEVHVLCYGNEIETMRTVVADLQKKGRRMSLIDATDHAALAIKQPPSI